MEVPMMRELKSRIEDELDVRAALGKSHLIVWAQAEHGPQPNPVEVFVDHEDDVEIAWDEIVEDTHAFKLD